MKKEEKVISRFPDLLQYLDEFRCKNEDWMFRGQADVAWELVPKAGRPDFARINDLELLRTGSRMRIPMSPIRPITSRIGSLSRSITAWRRVSSIGRSILWLPLILPLPQNLRGMACSIVS